MHLLLVLAAVAAQPADTVVYPAPFYARFAPNSALDMVNQTPGFTLQEGAVRRGFAGSGGNVLIDGERPSVKSATLESLLAQIPAGQVERIELIRGADEAGASQAHSVLLNVVRRRAVGKGTWKLNAAKTKGRHVSVDGALSWSGPTPAGDLNIGASRVEDYRPTEGDRTVGPAGGPGIVFFDYSPRTTMTYAANAELKRSLFGGAARLNARVQRIEFGNDQITLPPAASGRNVNTVVIEDLTDVAEMGGDWTRDTGGYTWTLVGLGTWKRFTDDVDAQSFNPARNRVFQQIQARETETTELIGRATVDHDLPGGHHLQMGLEGALNTFDAALALQLDTGGGLKPVPLPAANVHLEETRGEGFVSDAWPLGPWRIEATVAAEVSRLTQSGDTNLETNLLYVKPSLQVVRSLGKADQVRVKLYRDVSQLNFEDFVSFASVLDDRVVGGNPNLRPQTQWRLEAGYDKRFWGKGALNLMVYRAWASDVADVVPLLGKYDAPGNIGAGDFWGGSANLTLPVDRWIAGGLLTVQGKIDESRVTDPTTSETRRASGLAPTTLAVQFRQDFPAWRAAWGFSTIKFGGYALYRRAEIDAFELTTQYDAFVEKTWGGVKVRFYGINLGDYDSVRNRSFFAPDRNGAPSTFELRDRSRGRVLGVELRGAF